MKKEEIFVRIDSEEKRLRAIQILTDASEVIWNVSSILSSIFDIGGFGNLRFLPPHEEWIHVLNAGNLTEISIDQLEQLLAPNYAVQEVHLTIDEIRLQAEKLGFELVEKKREVKVGDFGMFWDDENPEMVCYGFLYEKNDTGFEDNLHVSTWGNFRHLTDEEKERITQNWQQ